MIKLFRHIRRSLHNLNQMCHHRTIVSLILVCLFVTSCDQSKQPSADNIAISEPQIVAQDSLTANQQWMQAVNTKDLEVLKGLYIETIYGLSTKGVEFSSRDTLLHIVKNNAFVVKEVQTIKRIAANDNFDYEIGSFKNVNDQLMKCVLIWDTSNNKEQRALEFIAATDSNKVDLNEITKKRNQWIDLCNAHNAEHLIKTLYTTNTMYYNHRPMVVGKDNLIPIYSYMNNENYSLSLKPIIVEPVSQTLAFEIGQCEGSYNGKYILIWQKTAEGWQVLFDANI